MKTQPYMMVAVAALSAMAWMLPAAAQSNRAYTVSRGTPAIARAERVPLVPGRQTSTYIAVRPVLDGSAVVDPALAATPTFPELVKVVYANSTAVFINPADRRFIRSTDGIGHLDDNHSLLRAIRVAESVNRPGAYVVSRVPRATVDRPSAPARPILRIRKPDPVTTPQPVAMADRD
ncbi:MAG: hypothetical protein AAFY08_15775 [Planctomycetota bacterium]